MTARCRTPVLVTLFLAAFLAGPAAAAPGARIADDVVPVFEVDPAWPKVPPQWKLGDASSIGIDARDNVWVLHRPRTLPAAEADKAAPPVLVFDSRGGFVKAWGGAQDGMEWPEREHGIHLDPRGHVWIGGNNCIGRNLPGLKAAGDDQLLKLTQDGRLVMQIGRSSQSRGNADTRNLHQPADVWVHRRTNELFVADGYGNHRVAVYDADSGEFKRMWGAFGGTPEDRDECPPPSLKAVPDGPGPWQFSIVHAIRVSNDGYVYVADRENRRVQVFTLHGRYLGQVMRHHAPFARNLAFSADPDQRFLYVGGGNDVVVVDRRTLRIVELIGGKGVLGGGHQIATDSKGNLYIAQTSRGLQKLAFKGLRPRSQ